MPTMSSTTEVSMRTLVLILVVVVWGCTRPNALPISDDAGTDCAAHADRASCAADPRCVVAGCTQCDGSTNFVACADAHGPQPPVFCPLPKCAAACKGLDEGMCRARPDCRADYCPNCNGGSVFALCSPADAPITACGGAFCPFPCDQATNLTECNARPGCHAVFQAGQCDFTNQCCIAFSHCADGGTANCKGPASCEMPAPACLDPACKGAYAVAFAANGCYEGCVQVSACAP
jgi:hypothetical protein